MRVRLPRVTALLILYSVAVPLTNGAIKMSYANAAHLYMVMKGCERELNRLGYGDGKPNIPVGVHDFTGKTLLVDVKGTVLRDSVGTAGDGQDWFTPTPRALNLKSMCLALHRTGFNADRTAEIIAESVRASETGEVEKAKDAIPVEATAERILSIIRSVDAKRPTRACITPHRGCFLDVREA